MFKNNEILRILEEVKIPGNKMFDFFKRSPVDKYKNYVGKAFKQIWEASAEADAWIGKIHAGELRKYGKKMLEGRSYFWPYDDAEAADYAERFTLTMSYLEKALEFRHTHPEHTVEFDETLNEKELKYVLSELKNSIGLLKEHKFKGLPFRYEVSEKGVNGVWFYKKGVWGRHLK